MLVSHFIYSGTYRLLDWLGLWVTSLVLIVDPREARHATVILFSFHTKGMSR